MAAVAKRFPAGAAESLARVALRMVSANHAKGEELAALIEEIDADLLTFERMADEIATGAARVPIPEELPPTPEEERAWRQRHAQWLDDAARWGEVARQISDLLDIGGHAAAAAHRLHAAAVKMQGALAGAAERLEEYLDRIDLAASDDTDRVSLDDMKRELGM
jgi:hypothetical protein